MKTKEYKGYILEFSQASIGFFSSGRAGKVVRKIWVYNPLTPGFGKWCKSESEAKKFINEETK